MQFVILFTSNRKIYIFYASGHTSGAVSFLDVLINYVNLAVSVPNFLGRFFEHVV